MISVVLVGLGEVGAGYRPIGGSAACLNHAASIPNCDGMVLTAGVDPSRSARDRFSEQWQVPSFDSIGAASEQYKPDLVVVAVPTSTQLEAVRSVTSTLAPRAVLVEKPMGASLTEAHEIADTLESKGVLGFVNYHRNYWSSADRMSKSLAHSESASLLYGLGQFSGSLVGNGSHMISLVMKLLGDPHCDLAELDDDLGGGRSRRLYRLSVRGTPILLAQLPEAEADLFEFTLMGTDGGVALRGDPEALAWIGPGPDSVYASRKRFHVLLKDNECTGTAPFSGTYARIRDVLSGAPSNGSELEYALATWRVMENLR